MHYPHRVSKKHRQKKVGYRKRRLTHHGRKMLNRKRRAGRKLQVV